MKKLILIVFTCIIISCGKSTYYVYDTTNNKDYYNYCTLEITKKNEIIYRASSIEYWYYSTPNNLFVYIKSDKYATNINENHYGFISGGISDISTLRIGSDQNFKHHFMYFNDLNYSIFYRIDSNDTITNTANKDFEYLKNSVGFKENGINWFPPYMVKTDKIDYSKFGEKVQHLNLENPKKNKRKK